MSGSVAVAGGLGEERLSNPPLYKKPAPKAPRTERHLCCAHGATHLTSIAIRSWIYDQVEMLRLAKEKLQPTSCCYILTYVVSLRPCASFWFWPSNNKLGISYAYVGIAVTGIAFGRKWLQPRNVFL